MMHDPIDLAIIIGLAALASLVMATVMAVLATRRELRRCWSRRYGPSWDKGDKELVERGWQIACRDKPAGDKEVLEDFKGKQEDPA